MGLLLDWGGYWAGVVAGLGWLLDWGGYWTRVGWRRFGGVTRSEKGERRHVAFLLLRKKGIINCYEANPQVLGKGLVITRGRERAVVRL